MDVISLDSFIGKTISSASLTGPRRLEIRFDDDSKVNFGSISQGFTVETGTIEDLSGTVITLFTVDDVHININSTKFTK